MRHPAGQRGGVLPRLLKLLLTALLVWLVITGLPVLLLFTEPRRSLRAEFWRGPPSPELRRYYQPSLDDLTPPPLPLIPDGRRPRWVRAPVPPLLFFLMLTIPPLGCLIEPRLRMPTYHFPPADIIALLLLWAWCGYRVLTDAEESAPSSTDGTSSVGAK